MHEAVVFSQPLDLLVVIVVHHCFQTAVISGSGLKVGMFSQKFPVQKKRTPPFKILDPPLGGGGGGGGGDSVVPTPLDLVCNCIV